MSQNNHHRLKNPEQLVSPCLLVYPQQIRANIAEAIRIAGCVTKLRPHVKTHKTPQIVALGLEAGITKYKCATLSEARMLGECSVADVLIAYPQVGPAVQRFGELVQRFPQTHFSTVIDDPLSVPQLEAEFAKLGLPLTVYLDIDTGMHRTGIPVGEAAIGLYRQISNSQVLVAGGLHIYDGQNHQSDVHERRAAVSALMQPIATMIAQLRDSGAQVPTLICGGTPTFPVYADLDLPETEISLECSPGTCLLSDFNYGRNYRDMSGFAPAAVLMTRVISRQHDDRITVDLGYKAVAADPPAGRRCHVLDLPQAKEILHNEEHLVLETPEAANWKLGDVLYALPAHICPTVALYSHLVVVEDGEIVDRWEVTSRDRIL